MKKIILMAAVILFAVSANAQVRKPVKKSQDVSAKQKILKAENKEKMKAIIQRKKEAMKKEG